MLNVWFCSLWENLYYRNNLGGNFYFFIQFCSPQLFRESHAASLTWQIKLDSLTKLLIKPNDQHMNIVSAGFSHYSYNQVVLFNSTKKISVPFDALSFNVLN